CRFRAGSVTVTRQCLDTISAALGRRRLNHRARVSWSGHAGRRPGRRHRRARRRILIHDLCILMHMSVLAPPAVATAAVYGSTGYAGRELLRLLAGHPRLRAVACTEGTRAPAQCDLALLALPHGASGETGRELAGARLPVIDLSADLRGEWQY